MLVMEDQEGLIPDTPEEMVQKFYHQENEDIL
jgi:hypothetical protein